MIWGGYRDKEKEMNHNRSPHTIKILSDHKNLEIFKEMCKLLRRQVRWALYLSRFNFQIIHTPGKNAGKPDALSRWPDHEEGKHDNEDCILLPESLFAKQLTIKIINTQFQQQIQDCQQLNDEVLTILQHLWPRTFSHQSLGRMVTLPQRIPSHHWNPLWPQKPRNLQGNMQTI